MQLHDDDVAEGHRLAGVTERGRQLRIMADGYQLDRERRESFVCGIAEFAIHSARQEAVDVDVTEGSTEAISNYRYPVM